MSSSSPGVSPLPLSAVALRVRRHRNHIFNEKVFADPAWDILLMLQSIGPLSPPVLAKEIELSENVLERWLGVMVDKGLVEHTPDGAIKLTELAAHKLQRIFSEAVLANQV